MNWSGLVLVRMDAVVRLMRALNDAQGAAMLSTLVTMASNALSYGGGADGSKFRTVKATSGLLTRSVLCVPGGDAALMLLGFEPRIVDKVKTFVVSECELCRRRRLHCGRVPGPGSLERGGCSDGCCTAEPRTPDVHRSTPMATFMIRS